MPVVSAEAALHPPAVADPLPGQATAPHLTLLANPLAPALAIAPALALIPPSLAPSLALAWPPMACGAPPGHWQGSWGCEDQSSDIFITTTNLPRNEWTLKSC